MRSSILLSFVLASALPATVAFAQSNQNPGIDVELFRIRQFQVVGRLGVFPAGKNAISFESTVCNIGSVPIPWMAAMDPDHPFFAFSVAREANGRLEQISDRSYIKHGFAAGNSSTCGNCILPPGPLGSALGVGCADVYSVSTNAMQMQLAPAEEIDPWLGIWQRTCSHFDRGEPPVPPPNNCDNKRSLTQQQVSQFSSIHHRVVVDDQEFALGGSEFFFQCQFVTAGEPEAVRGDSLGSRRFTATWTGSSWDLNEAGALRLGSVLEQWSGASVSSATNGADDGRVYVAVQVTEAPGGFYHYEYALHNRDNARGIGALRVPICRRARVRNLGFHDVDDDPTNDWTAAVGATEIVFSTPDAPQRWNTVFNFWFDCDASPISEELVLDAFDPGPGSSVLFVTSSAPTGVFNAYLGQGCSRTTPPSLYATGNPPRAGLGNATFALESAGNAPGAESVLYCALEHASLAFERCTLWIGRSPHPLSIARADAEGVAVHPLPIPNDPALEGLAVDFQCASLTGESGAIFRRFDLSDALRVRIGNALSDCP